MDRRRFASRDLLEQQPFLRSIPQKRTSRDAPRAQRPVPRIRAAKSQSHLCAKTRVPSGSSNGISRRHDSPPPRCSQIPEQACCCRPRGSRFLSQRFLVTQRVGAGNRTDSDLGSKAGNSPSEQSPPRITGDGQTRGKCPIRTQCLRITVRKRTFIPVGLQLCQQSWHHAHQGFPTPGVANV